MAEADEDRLPLLGVLGVSEVEERVYRSLLECGEGSLADVADWARLPERRARETVASLEEKGLVSRTATRPTRYLPSAPDAAVEILVLRRQAELDQARVAAARLAEGFRARRRTASSDEVVEVIAGTEAVGQRIRQLLNAAREEILGFASPPIGQITDEWIGWKLEILGRGVRGRVVYAPGALEVPRMLEFIEKMAAAGELPRTAASLPMPLLIVDRRVACLPLRPEHPGINSEFLVVRDSSLLEALVLLFEHVWDRAAPLPVAGAGTWADPETGWEPSPEDRRLLTLLAAGMKDAPMARQLGLSPRTAERRLATMMEMLGTRTRFQTAVEACRRGWLLDDAVGDGTA